MKSKFDILFEKLSEIREIASKNRDKFVNRMIDAECTHLIIRMNNIYTNGTPSQKSKFVKEYWNYAFEKEGK